MRLAELGERRLISEVVLPVLTKHQAEFVGDDCAVIPFDGERSLLITTDAGPRQSFLTSLGVGSFTDLGHFFATLSFSDIAAMAGTPLALVAAFICRSELSVTSFEDMVNGISRACEEVDAKYIGGDTNEGENLRVVTTALGIVDNDKILTRRGTQVGDILCTSGIVGRVLHSYLASARCKRKGKASCVVRPHARIDFGQMLGSQHLATACMDMSDGPISTAKTIGEMNQVMVNLDLDSLETSTPPVGDIDSEVWKELVLNVGGDFELMFTAHPTHAKTLANLGAIICGSIAAPDEAGFGVRLSGAVRSGTLSPWEHFRSTTTITEILKELV